MKNNLNNANINIEQYNFECKRIFSCDIILPCFRQINLTLYIHCHSTRWCHQIPSFIIFTLSSSTSTSEKPEEDMETTSQLDETPTQDEERHPLVINADDDHHDE